MEEKISPEDFAVIKDLRTKNAFVASRAEKAILDSRVAELEYKNAILNIYVKYGLGIKDTIDETSGKIIKETKLEKEENENS